jgi:hypothetical protein
MLHRAIRQFKLPQELASTLSNIPYFPLETKKTPSLPAPVPNTVNRLGGLRGGGMKEGRALDDAWNCLLRFNDQ